MLQDLDLVGEQKGKFIANIANADGFIICSSSLGVSREVLEPAMAPTQAEIKLIELKNCFVNVPLSIVSLLENAKAVSSQIALFQCIAYILSGRPERCR